MTQTVAVSGASGFVGRVLCQDLVRRGHRVVPLDRGALRAESLAQVLRGASVMIHLAARAHILTETARDSDAAYREANLALTQYLGRECRSAGVRRFVFVSSAGVLGAVSPTQGFDDETLPRPYDAYSRSKLESERWLQSELRRTVEIEIVRPPLIYGPNAKGNLMRLMRVALSGWPLPLGDLRAPRSMIGVRNFVDLLAALVATDSPGGQPMLAADRELTSVAELYGDVARLAGHRPWLAPLPQSVIRALLALAGRGSDIVRLTAPYVLRPSVAHKRLGWAPPHSMEEELRWTIAAELAARRAP